MLNFKLKFRLGPWVLKTCSLHNIFSFCLLNFLSGKASMLMFSSIMLTMFTVLVSMLTFALNSTAETDSNVISLTINKSSRSDYWSS